MIFLFKLLIAFSLTNQSFKKELHSQARRLIPFSMANSIHHPDKAYVASLIQLLSRSLSSSLLGLGTISQEPWVLETPIFPVTPFTEVQQDDNPT